MGFISGGFFKIAGDGKYLGALLVQYSHND